MKKLWKLIDHNQGVSIAVVIITGILIWVMGCESQTKSLIQEGKVTRPELQQEISNFLATAEIRIADLDRQDEAKRRIFEFAAGAIETGGVNPMGVVNLAMALLCGGAVIDNRRKDTVIKVKKT